MNYVMLQPEEQLTIVRVRLAEAEKRHYDACLCDSLGRGLGPSPTPELEASVTYLTGEMNRLSNLTNQSTP